MIYKSLIIALISAISCFAQAPVVIQQTDEISASRAVINSNFSSLYAGQQNVVQTTGSYANPTWITSLAWSKIFGAPGFLQQSLNLSDLPNVATARTNLGLGNAATHGPTITINSTSCTLDGSCSVVTGGTIPSTTNVLTGDGAGNAANSGLAAGSLVTLTGIQTLTNKSLTSPVLTTPALGTPTSVLLTNALGLPLTTGVVGILPIASGGTGTTSTLTGLVRGNSSAMTAAELSGDATTSGSNVVVVGKVNGGSFPVSAAVIGTNSSSQVIAATSHALAAPLLCSDVSGSNSAQSCTTNPTFVPAAGDTILYKTTTSNAGDLTVNVNASGAVHVRKWLATATLAAVDLPAGIPIYLTFDGTYWETYTIGNVPAGSGGGMIAATTNVLAGNGAGNAIDAGMAPSAVVTLTGTQTLTNKTLTAPTMTAPILGTPASGTATNITGLPLTTGVTGTLPVGNGGTGTASTLTGVVRGGSPLTASELSGDVTTSGSNVTTVGKVNGGVVPASASVTGTNSSNQIVAATAHGMAAPLLCSNTTASGTAQLCTTTPTFVPASGDTILYKTNTTNTGDLTINVNSSSAVHVRKWLGSTVLAAADLPANIPVYLTFDGTFWEAYSIGNAPSGGGGTGCVPAGSNAQLLTDSGTGTCVSNGGASFTSGTLSLGTPGSLVGSTAYRNTTSGSVTVQPVTGALGSAVLSLPATTGTIATVSGALGTPTSIVLTNATGLPIATGVTGILPAANGGTGVANANTITVSGNTTFTGAFNPTFAIPSSSTWTFPTGSDTLVTLTATQTLTNKTFVAPALGTPASGTLTNAIGLPLTTGVTGILPVANGGTGTASTLSGLVRGGATMTATELSGDATTSGSNVVSVTRVNGLAVPASAVLLASNSSRQFTAATTTGTGSTAVLATSPTLVTPVLGTPTSVTLTNGTGLPVSTGISGLGAGVATALGAAVSGTGSICLASGSACSGGGGSVTSVALTVPSFLSVAGSPITTSGTLAVTAATGQTANRFLATPNGVTGAVSLRNILAADLPLISLASGVSGVLPTANGGSGTASTLTGLMRGGSPFTAAELSGDATTSGSNAVTVARVNGGNLPASAAVTGTNSSSQIVAATAHGLAAPLLCVDASGSATAQSCTTSPSFVPAAGDTILYKSSTTNTGDLTLNVNSSSAIHVRKWIGTSVLANADLPSAKPVYLTFDGTFWEMYVIGNAPGGGSGGTGCIPAGTVNQLLTDSGTGTCLSNAAAVYTSGNLSLGTAGSVVGSVAYKNATSGTVTVQPVTGALGSSVLSLPATTGTLATVSGALGTPTSVTLTNATGLPLATAVTGILPIANGGTNTSSTLTGIVRGGASYAGSELSGDAITSGSNIVSVVRVNGGSLPASAGVTGTNSGNQVIASTAHAMSLPLICSDSSGSPTAQLCTTSPTFVPAAGDTILYKTTTTNTGDLTLNVNSSSAIHVRKWLGTAVLAGADLPANTPAYLTFDGTFWEMYTIGNAPAGGGGSIAATTNILSGNGSGSAVSSGLAVASVATLTGVQTLTNKTLTAPAIGTPVSGVATNLTGLPLSTGVTGILPIVNGGTGTAAPGIVAGANISVTGGWPNSTIAIAGAIPVANGGTGLTSSGQVGQVMQSTGTGSVFFWDFPVSRIIPAANCVSGNAGSSWSTSITPACFGGSNNRGGVLPFADASVAQFNYELPQDWSTVQQPWIKLFFSSGANSSGTVNFTVATACTKSDGSVSADAGFTAADSFPTLTMGAGSNMEWSTSLQMTQVTAGNNCIPGGTMIVSISRATDTASAIVNVDKATITIATRPTDQAN